MSLKADPASKTPLAESLDSLHISAGLARRELFGGAIAISIPTTWRDVSQIRQVPDHQECYQDCTFKDGTKVGLQGTGGCIIVEILARQEDIKDEDAAAYFFLDLAEANGDVVGDLNYECVQCVGNSSERLKYDSKDIKREDIEERAKNLTPKLSALVKACSCIGLQFVEPLRNRPTLKEAKPSKIMVELCLLRLESVETDVLITLSLPCEQEGNRINKEQYSSLFSQILEGFEIVDWTLFG